MAQFWNQSCRPVNKKQNALSFSSHPCAAGIQSFAAHGGPLNNAFDVIVAGGGIAGLSAGLYAARFGRRTLVLGGNVPGGLLLSIEHIEGLPGFPEGVPGYDLCPIMQEQAEAAGAGFASAELERIETHGDGWCIHAGSETYTARALVVATGARLRALGVPGEAALDGKGVSHCASCDAPLLRGCAVVVVGSGDSAMQESLHLSSHASKVTMLHRGSALGGQASYRERVLADPRIEHRYGVVVTEILGDGAVTGVRMQPTGGGPGSELEASGVFVYIGVEPNAGVVRELVECDDRGHIRTDAYLRTARRGLFAAGIVRAGASGQAAGAAGDGVNAAIMADRYLRNGIWN
ncbi:MAG: NAD(P)/FAD-dependent oxidoreductase [Burkholderiaceae bacterium]|nr:NAD(P)/FAD-dependent oxidoreductase [Burkholderiaceae bacterium]